MTSMKMVPTSAGSKYTILISPIGMKDGQTMPDNIVFTLSSPDSKLENGTLHSVVACMAPSVRQIHYHDLTNDTS